MSSRELVASRRERERGRSRARSAVFDLNGRLGPEIEALPGYEGVAW